MDIQRLKELAHRLYVRSGQLNLYISLCDPEKERCFRDLDEIYTIYSQLFDYLSKS